MGSRVHAPATVGVETGNQVVPVSTGSSTNGGSSFGIEGAKFIHLEFWDKNRLKAKSYQGESFLTHEDG